jgi:ABC-type uncharacterized transport system permease subunit
MNRILFHMGWRFQRRTDISPLRKSFFKVLAVILAIMCAGFVLLATGEKPLELGLKILKSTFGTAFGREQLLNLTTPMLLTGLAVTLAGKMNLWNMGVEGQFLIGAWAATGIGLFIKGSTPIMLILMLVGASIVTGLYALFPAWMRIKLGISEILGTVLINYVAIYWALHFTQGPWRDTNTATSLFYSFRVPYELPKVTGSMHIGIFIGILLVIICIIAQAGTIWGYEIRAVGANQKTANFAGIAYKKHMFIIMFISGAIAGLAGGIQLAGVTNRLTTSISIGYGWNGVLVSCLGGDSFIALVPYSLLMALLLNGGIVLQTQGLSYFVITALIGLILLLASVGEIVATYKLIRITPTEVEVTIPEREVKDEPYLVSNKIQQEPDRKSDASFINRS